MIATSTLTGDMATAYIPFADVLGIATFEIGRGHAGVFGGDRVEMLWYIRRADDGEIAFNVSSLRSSIREMVRGAQNWPEH
jgi:hypothetical protein